MADSRKSELKRAWKAQERRTLVESFPVQSTVLRDLFAYIDRNDAPPCDHTLRNTNEFLSLRGIEAEPIVVWLRKHGGYCDCEVLLNVESALDGLIE